MQQVITKRAADDLDYQFDWAPITNADPGNACSWGVNGCDWLEPGEKIISWGLSEPNPAGIIIHDAALVNEATSILFFADGGTPGIDYTIVCSITTSAMPARKATAVIVLRVI